MENGLPLHMTADSQRELTIEKGMKAIERMQEESERNGNCNMTLDEINAEIAAARAERARTTGSNAMNYENMRDSGIPYIGEIPSHWRITKTLHCLSMPITDGPHTTPELYDDGVPFISAEAVSCGNGRIDFSHMRGYISEDFYEECCKKYVPQIDDIYMIKSGATTGRVAIVDTDRIFTIWSPLAVFRANRARILPQFLFYALQSDSYQKQVELGWTYGTQQNIGMRTLESLKVCLPPLIEQSAIANFLDAQCSTIDAIISEQQSLIAELEAYKKSLIYEAVTGKRKVG